jgi:hypothetical protein
MPASSVQKMRPADGMLLLRSYVGGGSRGIDSPSGADADIWALGVVSKRRDAPYRSGPKCGWVKVKTQAWREANRERWRLFERQ